MEGTDGGATEEESREGASCTVQRYVSKTVSSSGTSGEGAVDFIPPVSNDEDEASGEVELPYTSRPPGGSGLEKTGVDLNKNRENKESISPCQGSGSDRDRDNGSPLHLLSPGDFEVRYHSSCSSPQDGNDAVGKGVKISFIPSDGTGTELDVAISSRCGPGDKKGDTRHREVEAETVKGHAEDGAVPSKKMHVARSSFVKSCVAKPAIGADEVKVSCPRENVVVENYGVTQNKTPLPSTAGSVGCEELNKYGLQVLRKTVRKSKTGTGHDYVRFGDKFISRSGPGFREGGKPARSVELPECDKNARLDVPSVGVTSFEYGLLSEQRNRSDIISAPHVSGVRRPKIPSGHRYTLSSHEGRLLSPECGSAPRVSEQQQPRLCSPPIHRVLSSPPSGYRYVPTRHRSSCRCGSRSPSRSRRKDRRRRSDTESSDTESVGGDYHPYSRRRTERVSWRTDDFRHWKEEDLLKRHPNQEYWNHRPRGMRSSSRRNPGCPCRASSYPYEDLWSASEETVDCPLLHSGQGKRLRIGTCDGAQYSRKRLRPNGHAGQLVPTATQEGSVGTLEDALEQKDEGVGGDGTRIALVTARAMHRRYRRNKEPRPLGDRRVLEGKGQCRAEKDEIELGAAGSVSQPVLSSKEFRVGRKVLANVMRQRGLEIDKIADSACRSMRMPSWYDGPQPVQDIVNAFADLGNDGFLPFLNRIGELEVKEFSVWQGDLQVLGDKFMTLGMRHFASVVSKLHELYVHGDIARGVQLGRAARMQLLAALRDLQTPSMLQYFGRLPLQDAAYLGLIRSRTVGT